MKLTSAVLSFLLANAVESYAAFQPLSKTLLDLKLQRIAQFNGVERREALRRQDDNDTYPAQFFEQPLDHSNPKGFKWNQRYFVNQKHYKKGGPVIVLDGGETDVTDRLPFLDHGIVDILANATNGLGIILEHRYYGTSIPVQNFTTDSLRWLNNEQALADSANFLQHVKFDSIGIQDDLTAPKTAWIYYGGSYAGARSAHMKVLYPHIVYGAIASSGVTEAAISNWGYYDIIRRAAPTDCSTQWVHAVKEIDAFLDNPKTNDAIKSLFGVKGLTLNADLTVMFNNLLGAWQSLNWDPTQSSTSFNRSCTAMGAPGGAPISTTQGIKVSNATWNLATLVNRTTSQCPSNKTADECWGTIDDSQYQGTDLEQTWRLWPWQVCNQWAYFDAPPPPQAHVPSMVSKFVTVEYSHKFCQQAFLPGKYYQIPAWPKVQDVNKLGGFNIAADRLAIVDGEVDPWRFDCPHSFVSPSARRPDTIKRPFKLIPAAVHHWDENGLTDHSKEPADIKAIHQQEVDFVKAWLKDFKPGF